MAESIAYKKRANRQVCDVDITYRSSGKPFMYFETANTTTIGIESDAVYATAKGSRRIKFSNPLDGTITITAQVYPSKLYELISGNSAKNGACYAKALTIPCVDDGVLSLSLKENVIIKGETIFAYPEEYFGDNDCLIACTYTNGVLSGNFVPGHKYKVGFIVTQANGASTFTFNNKAPLAEYQITMSTINKNEEGEYTPMLMVVYRAIMNRNIELSFSSEGEPAEITFTFTVFSDRLGRFVDMVEIADLHTFQPGDIELPYYIILTDDDEGNVTMTFATKPNGE